MAKAQKKVKAMAKVRSTADGLIDQALRPKCPSPYHRASPAVQALLDKARERTRSGEVISGARLSEIIHREFGESISDDSLRRYMRTGCRCQTR